MMDCNVWVGDSIEARRITCAEAVVVLDDLAAREIVHDVVVDRLNINEIIVFRSQSQRRWARANPDKLERCGGAIRYVVNPPMPRSLRAA